MKLNLESLNVGKINVEDIYQNGKKKYLWDIISDSPIVSVLDTLIVRKDVVTLKGKLDAHDASFNNVDVSGNLKVKGKLDVWDASFNNVDVSGNLNVDVLIFNANPTWLYKHTPKTLCVENATKLEGKLYAGDASFYNVNVRGNLNWDKELDVSGANVSNNLTANTLSVKSTTKLKGKLYALVCEFQ